MEATNSMVNKTKNHLLALYNRPDAKRLVYHDFQMLSETARLVEDIGLSSPQISPDEQEAAQIAAWFQYASILEGGQINAEKSASMASNFLQSHNYPQQGIEAVSNAILSVHSPHLNKGNIGQLLNDANVAYTFTTNFQQLIPLHRLEAEVLENRRYENLEWEEKMHQRLFDQQFLLPFSKENFGAMLAQNKLEQEQRIRSLQRKKQRGDILGEGLRNFQNLERKLPERATQTFFRANYRNHINLSSIADNKANIMIGINAIMMTIVVSVLSYGNIAFERPVILMPVVMFLFTGLASMISAVLSARPKVTMLNPEGTPHEEAKKNIVFFGNFVHLSQEEYENAMDAMLRDSELMYGNMVRDLYHLGKVLDKKYRLLTLSYNIFMVGFVATMLAFLVAFYFY